MKREYPGDQDNYMRILRRSFRQSPAPCEDPEQEIQAGIKRAQYILRELEALRHVRQYRWLKRHYDDTSHP